MVVIEHPPACDRVAQSHSARHDGVPLDVVLLTVDPSQLSGLEALLLADEHLDLLGEPQEAAIEVTGDPSSPAFGDTVGGLDGVVARVPAEQHDLGTVVLSSQWPRLLLLVERTPEVAAPVGPALGFEAPAAVGVALEADQRAVASVPGAVLEAVRVARSGGDLRADTEVAAGGLLAARLRPAG